MKAAEARLILNQLLDYAGPQAGPLYRTLLQFIDQVESTEDAPIPMRLRCPSCGELHIDVGEFETKRHHTHACQHCGEVWRPAIVCTVGVDFLPGFRNG